MYFFFHLVTGIILGLLLGDLLRDRRWIVPCIIGSVLPDLVDKPLNFILLPAINGNGRFLFHNLIVFIVLLVIGFLLWKYYASPFLLALDTGVLSHQILDFMWTDDPVRWLYPLLGPSPGHAIHQTDYLLSLLEIDLNNPVEWVLILVSVCVLVIYRYRVPLAASAGTHKKIISQFLNGAEILLWGICGIIFVCGLLNIPLRYLAVYSADQDIFVIGVIILAIILLERWKEKIQVQSGSQ